MQPWWWRNNKKCGKTSNNSSETASRVIQTTTVFAELRLRGTNVVFTHTESKQQPLSLSHTFKLTYMAGVVHLIYILSLGCNKFLSPFSTILVHILVSYCMHTCHSGSVWTCILILILRSFIKWNFSFQMETSQINWVNYALMHLYLIFTFSQIGKLLSFVETPQLVSFELLDFWALIEICINSLHNTGKKIHAYPQHHVGQCRLEFQFSYLLHLVYDNMYRLQVFYSCLSYRKWGDDWILLALVTPYLLAAINKERGVLQCTNH